LIAGKPSFEVVLPLITVVTRIDGRFSGVLFATLNEGMAQILLKK
jgi:hypothetical protein